MNARPITILALVQLAIVFLGYVSLVGAMKLRGYPNEFFVWPPFTVFLRQHGLWMLLLPISFVAWSLFSEAARPSRNSEGRTLIVGVLIAVLLFLGFVFAAINTRPREGIVRGQTGSPPVSANRLEN